MRDLADHCREREVQIILTTHSPYILEELPPYGRYYILEADGIKRIVTGVSPQFAMTQMDDENYPECDYTSKIRPQRYGWLRYYLLMPESYSPGVALCLTGLLMLVTPSGKWLSRTVR